MTILLLLHMSSPMSYELDEKSHTDETFNENYDAFAEYGSKTS